MFHSCKKPKPKEHFTESWLIYLLASGYVVHFPQEHSQEVVLPLNLVSYLLQNGQYSLPYFVECKENWHFEEHLRQGSFWSRVAGSRTVLQLKFLAWAMPNTPGLHASVLFFLKLFSKYWLYVATIIIIHYVFSFTDMVQCWEFCLPGKRLPSDVRGIAFTLSLPTCKACDSYVYTSMKMITENKSLFSVNAK